MAAIGSQVSVTTAATLIFQCVDSTTYANAGYTRAGNPQIFVEGAAGDPLPLLLAFPTGTIFLGGSGVTAASTGIGAAIAGPYTLAYNVIGGDSLYGIAGSTLVVSVLAMRQ